MADDTIEPAGLNALTAGQPVAMEVIATEGVVLGSQDATPLEFWVGVREGGQLELDDLITIETVSPRGQTIRFFGIVDMVRKRYEGAQYDTDAFRATEGLLPVDISYAAHVQVTRIDPEVFIPPHPGDRVRLVRGVEFEEALSFDRMEHRLPIGLTRTGEPVYANLEFLDGTRGAHASISGVSGVATKTSYANFLLYALFHSQALGPEAVNCRRELLTSRFRGDAVNLLMGHTHLDGAVLAGSERQVHLGDEWAMTAQSLPSAAHYVALGHIHRPQRIEAAPSPACYAGSPLQLDFGEVGEEKSFVVIRAEPGRPAKVERVPYSGGKPLCEVRMTLADLEREADRLREGGWLRVTVALDAPDFDLNRRVRQLLGAAVVSVDYELPERPPPTPEQSRSGLGPTELFALYHRSIHQAEPSAPIIAAFNDLLREAVEAPE